MYSTFYNLYKSSFFLQSSKSESSDVIAQVKNNHINASSAEENKSKFGIQTQVLILISSVACTMILILKV